eukprot:GEMP01056565.1.p1 GENE.GEMP01056565.1~~GEMP01056565.1.p1  ORF type:complete len:166 (+),score=42.55 GEMP01056565.1:82-579(+)
MAESPRLASAPADWLEEKNRYESEILQLRQQVEALKRQRMLSCHGQHVVRHRSLSKKPRRSRSPRHDLSSPPFNNRPPIRLAVTRSESSPRMHFPDKAAPLSARKLPMTSLGGEDTTHQWYCSWNLRRDKKARKFKCSHSFNDNVWHSFRQWYRECYTHLDLDSC